MEEQLTINASRGSGVHFLILPRIAHCAEDSLWPGQALQSIPCVFATILTDRCPIPPPRPPRPGTMHPTFIQILRIGSCPAQILSAHEASLFLDLHQPQCLSLSYIALFLASLMTLTHST